MGVNDVNVQFKRGLLANLSSQSVVDGTIYVTTDEHAMYVDNGSQRIRLGDFIPVNTIQDLPAAGHAYETAVYYVKSGNILARWDGTNSRWIQINKAGVVGLTNQTQGTVISNIELVTDDIGQLTLRITKTDVASTAELSALATRMTTAEGHITNLNSDMTTLKGDVTTQGSILQQLKSATDALLNNETTYTTFKTIGDAIRSLNDDMSALETRVGTVETVAARADSASSTNTSAIATLNGNATTAGSVAYAVAQEAAARATSEAALSQRINTNADDIAGLDTRLDGLSDIPERVEALEDTAELLTADGNTQGSVQNLVNTAVVNLVNGAPTALDTLKEIADWIATHEDDATSLITRVGTLEQDLAQLESDHDDDIADLQDAIDTLNGDTTVNGSVDKKIATAMGTVVSDVASLQDDTQALATRVGTAETNIGSLQTSVNTINGDASTSGSIAYAVAQETSARTTAMNTLAGRVSTNERNIGELQDTTAGLATRVTTAETNITTLADNLTWHSFDPQGT